MSILLAHKLGMISVITDEGRLLATTLLKVEPNYVSQIKTTESDGYNAIQVSAIEAKKTNKAQLGHLKKAKIKLNLKIAQELRLKDEKATSNYDLGQKLDLGNWQIGDKVLVIGTSKGKGFAGTIKRHNFSRGPKTHGGKGSVRRPGSIGTIQQGVMKGQKMAGRLGGSRTTVKGLKVSLIDEDKQLIGISGALPGPRKSLITIKKV